MTKLIFDSTEKYKSIGEINDIIETLDDKSRKKFSEFIYHFNKTLNQFGFVVMGKNLLLQLNTQLYLLQLVKADYKLKLNEIQLRVFLRNNKDELDDIKIYRLISLLRCYTTGKIRNMKNRLIADKAMAKTR